MSSKPESTGGQSSLGWRSEALNETQQQAADEAQTPEISIVIPTYNRQSVLVRCIEALQDQTIDSDRFEVIVVDDGSTDETQAILAGMSTVRSFIQPENAGPGAARNVGIREARGAYILFLGDDTIARPNLLELHLAGHERVPGDHIAVLGYAPWDESDEITPFMREFFPFGYRKIQDNENAGYRFFYTSNVSISRQFLRDYGLYDERFRYAWGEDTELAYRLSQHGLKIIYCPQAIVDHSHPTTYKAARRRCQVIGEVGVLMAEIHPELESVEFLQFNRKSLVAFEIRQQLLRKILDPLLIMADNRRWDFKIQWPVISWALAQHKLSALRSSYLKHNTSDEQDSALQAKPHVYSNRKSV